MLLAALNFLLKYPRRRNSLRAFCKQNFCFYFVKNNEKKKDNKNIVKKKMKEFFHGGSSQSNRRREHRLKESIKMRVDYVFVALGHSISLHTHTKIINKNLNQT